MLYNLISIVGMFRVSTVHIVPIFGELLIQFHNYKCCIFQPAFGCRALQMLVEIVIFSVFTVKKLKKKQEICSKFLQKTCFLKFAPERWSTVLFPQKWAFFSKNMFLPIKSCETL